MGFEPLEWYCRTAANGIWARSVDSAFGACTPCAVDSLVISVSHLVLLGLCCYRIWLIKRASKVQKYCLRSKCYNYMLGLLSFYCTAEPLLRLVMGFSVFSLDGETSLLPYEMVSLTIESLAWCSILVMIGLEMHVYIREFRWYVRYGLIYVLVGGAVILNLILLKRDHYQRHRSALFLYISKVFCQVLFGILLLVYVPNLVPYQGYTMIYTEPLDSVEYEALPGEEQVCPERHVSIFSRMYFWWMTPLMLQGYKRPITEKDVWKLDSWDQTETLFKRFQKCWAKESQRPKPWLLRALNSSLGGRFWLGGFFKIATGPTLLNHLLQSVQRGDPAWIGYVYAFSILVGVSFGVLCEAQYFQNAYRTGFRLRSTLVAAIFRKSLRLSHEGGKKFQSGKITNMITTDANAIEQVCQELHNLWSAPFRIVIAMVLLYQQLGVASLLGSLVLVLMIPLQTVIISKMRCQPHERNLGRNGHCEMLCSGKDLSI